MSEIPPTVAGGPGDSPALGDDPDADLSGVRSVHVWISVLPAVLVALVGAVAIAALLNAPPSDMTAAVVLIAAGACAALVLAGAVLLAERATSRVRRAADAMRRRSERTRGELLRLSARIERGEEVRPVAEPRLPTGVDAFALLAHEQRAALTAAWNAAVRAHRAQAARAEAAGEAWTQQAAQPQAPQPAQAAQPVQAAQPAPAQWDAAAGGGVPTSGLGTGQQVEVFVNVARRMQSLVHRQIGLLDELEAQVEDPDLLKGLFTIDHLATRMRRQSESLAVLGGASSRRRWSRPVNLYEVLRSAVAEVDDYSRVKVVPPTGGTLAGGAVVDVIHLIAELVENATKFSPPRTRVLLRTEEVGAGMAVEVEDRGLGVPPEERRRMNELLAEPDRVDIGELLRDGRIGLFVVATLARKHGARVQLQSSVYGGTLAVLVLPSGLLGNAEERPRRRTAPAADEDSAPAEAPAVAETPAPAPAAASGERPAPGVPSDPAAASGREAPPAPASAPAPAPAPAPGPARAEAGASGPAPGPMPSSQSSVINSAFERAGVARPSPPPAQAQAPAPPQPQAHAQPPAQPQPSAQAEPRTQPQPQPSAQTRPPEHARPPAPAAPAAPAAPSAPAGQPVSSPPTQAPASPRDRAPASPPVPPDNAERPPLPERRVQENLAPELRQTPGSGSEAPDADVPSLGLMAAYQGGFQRAEQEGGDDASTV